MDVIINNNVDKLQSIWWCLSQTQLIQGERFVYQGCQVCSFSTELGYLFSRVVFILWVKVASFSSSCYFIIFIVYCSFFFMRTCFFILYVYIVIFRKCLCEMHNSGCKILFNIWADVIGLVLDFLLSIWLFLLYRSGNPAIHPINKL